MRSIELKKGAGGSLGLQFVGPSSHSQRPQGVFVSRVLPGGMAAASGQIFSGDQIITVNGVDVRKSSHTEVGALLQKAPGGVISIDVQSNPDGFALIRRKMDMMGARLASDAADTAGHVPSGSGSEQDLQQPSVCEGKGGEREEDGLVI